MVLLNNYAPALAKQQIVFQFNDEHLIASLFNCANNCLVHEVTKIYTLGQHVIVGGNLINRMRVEKLIADFITEQKGENAAISFVFGQPLVVQEIVYRPDKDIQKYLKQKWQAHHCQAHYLFSWEHEFCFYVCGIPQPVFFCYLLLASGRPLQTVTTRYASMLQVYRKQQGSLLNQSQLAVTMRASNHTVPIDYAKLATTISLPPVIDARLIGPAIGALL